MSVLPKAAVVAGTLLFAWPAQASNVIAAPVSGDWSEILLNITFAAAGEAAMTAFYVPASRASGASLAEAVVSGAGLTAFMPGDDNGGVIVAGKSYGHGSLLFSALTDSVFGYPGPGGLLGDTRELVADTIVPAANGFGPSAVPRPASAASMEARWRHLPDWVSGHGAGLWPGLAPSAA